MPDLTDLSSNIPTTNAIGQPLGHPDTIGAIVQFRTFAQSHDLELPAKLIDDGKVHRFALPGDMPPVKNGAYMLHPMIANKNPSGNVRDFRGDDPAHIWVYKASHTQPPISEYDRLPMTHDPDDGAGDDDMPPSYYGVPDDDTDRAKTSPETPAKVTGQQMGKAVSSLKKFSLSGKSAEMRKQMLDDKFVMHLIAILGQITVIYAMQNTGKTLLTLWLLIKAVKDGTINPDDIFYINADDNEKGLVQKLELAEEHGFHMIAPGRSGFKANELKDNMAEMVKLGSARGVVIVLDTLKKFTDLMDKKTSSGFMRGAREFAANGGTLIFLAHTNKRREEGKAIYGGTSDVVDDCDCAFILDEANKASGVKRVMFENIKSRGDVASQLAFDYATGVKHYGELLHSVKMIDMEEERQTEIKAAAADERAHDTVAINAIKEALRSGINSKIKLLSTAKALAALTGAKIGKPRLEAVLIRYTGTKHSDTCLWRTEIGDKNAMLYYELESDNYTEEDYKSASDGE